MKYETKPQVKIPSTLVETGPSRLELILWWVLFSLNVALGVGILVLGTMRIIAE